MIVWISKNLLCNIFSSQESQPKQVGFFGALNEVMTA